MLTGIVILNYNNYADTINCIQTVVKFCDQVNKAIVVVDNGSQNDSVSQISGYLEHNQLIYSEIKDPNSTDFQLNGISIIQTNCNLGYARGNNVGIRFLIEQGATNILILNNDILLTSEIISPMIDCLDTNPEIGLVSPVLMKDNLNIDYTCCRRNLTYKMLIFEISQFLRIPGTDKTIDQIYLLKSKPELLNFPLVYCEILSGACIMASAKTWQLLNGFDENTFLYAEEFILCEKLKNLNLKSAVLTKISAIHLGAQSTKKIRSTRLLRTGMNSLVYYLKTYRNANFLLILTIKIICLSRIYLFTAKTVLISLGRILKKSFQVLTSFMSFC